MLCDVVCAMAYAVGCLLRFSRGETGEVCSGWLGWGAQQLRNEQA